MGMTGCYIRMDDDTVKQIQNGKALNISANNENLLDIDKSWHAIHFILTGEVWGVDEKNIISQLILGGTPVNDEDMGYGPARLLTKAVVSQLADALEKYDESYFRKEYAIFNLEAMIENQVYPVMDNDNEDEFFEYIWSNLREIKKFFRKAADCGQNIISFIY